jgi:hypothetical protein
MSATNYLRFEHLSHFSWGADSASMTNFGKVERIRLTLDPDLQPAYGDGAHTAIGTGEGNHAVDLEFDGFMLGGKAFINVMGVAVGTAWGENTQTEFYVDLHYAMSTMIVQDYRLIGCKFRHFEIVGEQGKDVKIRAAIFARNIRPVSATPDTSG